MNKIKILALGPGCRKAKKIMKSMKEFIDENSINVEFEIVSSLKEFLKYKTWILPTVVINNKVVARGYRPTNEVIISNLNKT